MTSESTKDGIKVFWFIVFENLTCFHLYNISSDLVQLSSLPKIACIPMLDQVPVLCTPKACICPIANYITMRMLAFMSTSLTDLYIPKHYLMSGI